MASWKAHNQMLTLPILLITCSSLLVQSARLHATQQEGDDLITSTCKHTIHYELCVSSLRSDPRSATSDLKGLVEIALNLSMSSAAKTLSYVNELKSSIESSSSSNNSYMSKCLSDCLQEYSEAIDNLQDSARAFGNGDYDRVDTFVSAAITDAETCDDGFQEMLNARDDKDDNGYSSLAKFPIVAAVRVIGVLVALLLFTWAFHFRGGLALVSGNKDLIFNVIFFRLSAF